MLLKPQEISAAHPALCLLFVTQKEILHFVLQNSSGASEYDYLYLPGTFSPQIWKRVSTGISTLLCAEMKWTGCASVYLCLVSCGQTEEKPVASPWPVCLLVWLQPSQHTCRTLIWMLLLGRVTDHCCVNQHQCGLRCTILCRDHCLHCIDTALNCPGWSVTSTHFVHGVKTNLPSHHR